MLQSHCLRAHPQAGAGAVCDSGEFKGATVVGATALRCSETFGVCEGVCEGVSDRVFERTPGDL